MVAMRNVVYSPVPVLWSACVCVCVFGPHWTNFLVPVCYWMTFQLFRRPADPCCLTDCECAHALQDVCLHARACASAPALLGGFCMCPVCVSVLSCQSSTHLCHFLPISTHTHAAHTQACCRHEGLAHIEHVSYLAMLGQAARCWSIEMFFNISNQ